MQNTCGTWEGKDRQPTLATLLPNIKWSTHFETKEFTEILSFVNGQVYHIVANISTSKWSDLKWYFSFFCVWYFSVIQKLSVHLPLLDSSCCRSPCTCSQLNTAQLEHIYVTVQWQDLFVNFILKWDKKWEL